MNLLFEYFYIHRAYSC